MKSTAGVGEGARHVDNQRASTPRQLSVPEVTRLLTGLKNREEAVQATSGA